MIDARESVLPILHADAPPNVRLSCCKVDSGVEQIAQTFGALGQNLECVPIRGGHHPRHGFNIVIGHTLVEQVTHRVYKNLFRSSPLQRLRQLVRHETQIKALLVWMLRDSPESLCECASITMSAARTDLCAPSNRIPGSVCPLNFGVVTHSFPALS